MQKIFSRGLLALLFTAVGVSAGFAQANTTVQEIRFVGLQNIRENELRDVIPLKRGEVFSMSRLNESIKAIYETGKVSDVEASREQLTNGFRLIFRVTENPYVRWIRFRNVGGLNVDDMKAAIPIQEEGYFTDAMISESLAILKQKYRDEGYRNVSIEVQKEPFDVQRRTNAYDIYFAVDRKERIVVERIIITGNQAIRASEIKNAMKTKERFWFIIPGVLKEEEFEQDRQTIKLLYKQKGFFDIQIERFTWFVTNVGRDNRAVIYVEIAVNEGIQYYTGNITIENNTIFTTEVLRPLVALKEGDIYNFIQMEIGRYNIYTRYANSGYLFANVALIPEKRPNTNVIDTRLIIFEGRRAHIERILITGNTRTLTRVIQREVLFREGEIYINRKVEQTRDRLMRTEFFSDVQILNYPGSAEGLINLNIDVEETRTGMFTVGLTYGFESGFSAFLQVSEKNFMGTGRTVTARGEWAERRQSISLGFQEPYLFDMPISIGFNVGYSRDWFRNIPTDDNNDGIIDGSTFNYRDNPSNSFTTLTNDKFYHRDSFNVSVNLGRRFGVFWNGSFVIGSSFYQDAGANFRNPLVFTDHWNTNDFLLNELQRGWRFKNYFGITLTRNSTDNPFEPTRGSIFQQILTSHGGILGGETHFIKTRTFFSTYFNPIWRIVLAYNISTEFLFPQIMNSRHEYLSSDALSYDGIWEMRGWMGLMRIGESKLYQSLELRYQIYDLWIWGAFILDVGNLWKTYDGFAPLNPEGTMFSFGPGIRFNIPGFPLRFYLVRRGFYDSDQNRFRLERTDDLWQHWQFVFSIQGMF